MEQVRKISPEVFPFPRNFPAVQREEGFFPPKEIRTKARMQTEDFWGRVQPGG
jgi:hypothetical protein